MNEFVGYIDDQGRVFDGTFDYEGHVGPIGPQGEPGYTPQRGVDYWTDEDKAYVVTEATSLINGKIEEYNANATAKTNAFNQNAIDKTDAFNSNATSKTGAFNDNASDKTTDFNSNATSKTGDFNDNATAKTTAFDAHVDSEFDDLTGNFYTKAQVDAKIASTYHYKGSVTDYTELPSSGQQVGDVYNIENAGGGYNAGDNVAWTGSAWDILAGTVDLTNYYTKSQSDTLLGGKQNTIDSKNKLASDLVDDTKQTNKFVTEADKTNWNGKEDAEDAEAKYEELKAENEQLLSQIPTTTATGTTINVQDSSNLPLKEFDLLGNATQYTTTGKNILDKSQMVNGWFSWQDNSESSSTVMVRTDFFPIEPSTYYTISSDISLGEVAWIYKKDDDTIITGNNNNIGAGKIVTFQTNSQASYIRIRIGSSSYPIQTSTNFVVMLEKGQTATPYEPYTGGKASPNPDYPQDIHVVTGDNTLVKLGKNLIPSASGNETQNSISLGITNNIINVSFSGESKNAAFGIDGSIRKTNYGDYVNWNNLKLKAGTYTLSYKYLSGTTNATADGGNSMRAIVYGRAIGDTGRVRTNLAQVYCLTQDSYSSFTITEDMEINIVVYAYLYRQGGNSININFQVQLERGSTATPYEPYITPQTQLLSLGNIELAKIGTYQDRIYKSGGKWWLEKNIGKVTLNGSEDSWTWADNRRFIVRVSENANTSATQINAISNLFIGVVAASAGTWGGNTGISAQGDYIHLVTGDSSIDGNVSALQTLLNTKNLIVYYLLETPTTTEITDTTLLGQLENILKMHTNKNVTNISIVPTGTNAEPTAEVEYRVDLETVIGNIQTAILSL